MGLNVNPEGSVPLSQAGPVGLSHAPSAPFTPSSQTQAVAQTTSPMALAASRPTSAASALQSMQQTILKAATSMSQDAAELVPQFSSPLYASYSAAQPAVTAFTQLQTQLNNALSSMQPAISLGGNGVQGAISNAVTALKNLAAQLPAQGPITTALDKETGAPGLTPSAMFNALANGLQAQGSLMKTVAMLSGG